jgi:RND family efflux transporter MFP subunit
VVQPEEAPREATLILPGQTQAFYETTLYARVNGYLRRWFVDIGDEVKQGQLLATIETPELDQQLAEAKARLAALGADVQYAEDQLAFAKLSYQRWDLAAPHGAVSEQERDAKAAEYKTAQSKLRSAQAQLELGQASVRRLESELSFKQVTAPFGGTITQRRVDLGSLITAGSTASTTPLFTICRSDRIRVFVDVPQAATPSIAVGMPARITASEFPGLVFVGQVDRTSDAIDPTSRTLKVEVLIPNADQKLRPGMYVETTFEVIRQHPPLMIAAAALNLRSAGPQVAVVDRNNQVRFRDVRISRDLGDSLELADGLKAGEWLAVNVGEDIVDGETVTPLRLSSEMAGSSDRHAARVSRPLQPDPARIASGG